jgi:hypothetical protein
MVQNKNSHKACQNNFRLTNMNDLGPKEKEKIKCQIGENFHFLPKQMFWRDLESLASCA